MNMIKARDKGHAFEIFRSLRVEDIVEKHHIEPGGYEILDSEWWIDFNDKTKIYGFMMPVLLRYRNGQYALDYIFSGDHPYEPLICDLCRDPFIGEKPWFNVPICPDCRYEED